MKFILYNRDGNEVSVEEITKDKFMTENIKEVILRAAKRVSPTIIDEVSD